MQDEIFLLKNIAIGLDGRGFNCEVEAGFRRNSDFCAAKAEQALMQTLQQIDHKIIGIDVKLNPSFADLCRWVFTSLKNAGDLHPIAVKIRFGDQIGVDFRGS
jgi:hypothetical protein